MGHNPNFKWYNPKFSYLDSVIPISNWVLSHNPNFFSNPIVSNWANRALYLLYPSYCFAKMLLHMHYQTLGKAHAAVNKYRGDILFPLE